MTVCSPVSPGGTSVPDWHMLLTVVEVEPSIPEDVVLVRANAAEALLLTAEKDFGELVSRQRRVTTGVVRIRWAG
jgi:hypothetical protein